MRPGDRSNPFVTLSTRKKVADIWVSPTAQVFDGEPDAVPPGEWFQIVVIGYRDSDLSQAQKLYFMGHPSAELIPGWYNQPHVDALNAWINKRGDDLALAYYGPEQYAKIYKEPTTK